jgi:predicted SnoaL-like aldol condensation-catalyzing enzyme
MTKAVTLHVLSRLHDMGLKAVVDIFRLEGGKVLEHWDVIHPIPEMSANAPHDVLSSGEPR